MCRHFILSSWLHEQTRHSKTWFSFFTPANWVVDVMAIAKKLSVKNVPPSEQTTGMFTIVIPNSADYAR